MFEIVDFLGKETTLGAGVFYNKAPGIRIEAELHTSGDGFWSRSAHAVKITGLALGYISEESDFGELRVFFDTNSWDTRTDGLIYTDSQFETELQRFLDSLGFAGKDVSYSEQGMQGDNFVSCDVGAEFLVSWIKVVYDGDIEKFNIHNQ